MFDYNKRFEQDVPVYVYCIMAYYSYMFDCNKRFEQDVYAYCIMAYYCWALNRMQFKPLYIYIYIYIIYIST